MHPSDMAKKDWCGRHDYYRIIGTPSEKTSQANPSFRMENVFAEGHAIHGKYQTWLWEMGVLVGDFACKDCGHRWGDISPTKCQFCLSESTAPLQGVPAAPQPLLIEGHADAAIHRLDGLVEVKSIGMRTLAFEAPRLYQRYLDGTKPRGHLVGDQPSLHLPHAAGAAVPVDGLARLRADRLHLRVEVPPADQGVHSRVQQDSDRPLARNCEGCNNGGTSRATTLIARPGRRTRG